jgi:hypothetical protein
MLVDLAYLSPAFGGCITIRDDGRMLPTLDNASGSPYWGIAGVFHRPHKWFVFQVSSQ